MDYDMLLRGMERFGSVRGDVCMYGLGIPAELIRENVILAPSWEPPALPGLGQAEALNAAPFKIWNLRHERMDMTYIKTGIGAPVLMEALLALGVTGYRRIIFVGSVGALDVGMDIGDIVIPEYSVCGDGASRYIGSEDLRDIFGEKAYPDERLTEITRVRYWYPM